MESRDSLVYTVQKVTYYWGLSHEWDVFITHLHSKLCDLYGRGGKKYCNLERVNSFKEIAFSRHRLVDAHINSQRLVNMQKTCISSSLTETWAWRRGSGHKVPRLTKKTFSNDSCGERKNIFFFPMEWHWVFQPHSSAGLMLRSR